MEQHNNENLDQVLEDLHQSKALNSQQAQQISELISRYSHLEKMHNETLKMLDQLSHGGPLPNDVKESVEETATVRKITQQTVTDFVNRLIKVSKLKSQTALRFSIKTMRVDSLLSSLSSGLKRFAEKLGQLEQKIQGLGIEQQSSQPEIEKIQQPSELKITPQSRIRVGERRPEPAPSKAKVTQKAEAPKQEEVSEESQISTPEVERSGESKNATATALPEDFRPILEKIFIPIDAAHETQDELGNPTYGYRANHKIEVPGIPLELIKGLDSIKISNLLQKDLVNRLMDGRLSVDQVFTEEQQAQMVAAYGQSQKQPNAFEKRVAKAEVEKKEQKMAVSQSKDVAQEKHRSR